MIIQQVDQNPDYIGKIQKYYQKNQELLKQQIKEVARSRDAQLDKNDRELFAFGDVSTAEVGFNYKTGEIEIIPSGYDDDLIKHTPNWANLFTGIQPTLGYVNPDKEESIDYMVEKIIPEQIQQLHKEDWNYLSNKGFSTGVLPPLEYENDKERANLRLIRQLQLVPFGYTNGEKWSEEFGQIFSTTLSAKLLLLQDRPGGFYKLDENIANGLYKMFEPAISSDGEEISKYGAYLLSDLISETFIKNKMKKIANSDGSSYVAIRNLLKLLFSKKEDWSYFEAKFRHSNGGFLNTPEKYYANLAKINPEFSKHVQELTF